MDTLVIVRKIREAENLADGGNHSGAVKLLEPLLGQDGLGSAQRDLIKKKIDLIERQRQRATRIMQRAQEPEEPTVIALAEPDRTERPTETAIEKQAEGEPTEAVPRFDGREDREKTRKRPMRKSDPAMPTALDENATLRVPPPPGLLDPSDTQQVPRPPIYDHIVDTSENKLLPVSEDEPEVEDHTPVPTPADLTSGEHRKLAEIGVVPTPAPRPPAHDKRKTEVVEEDQHFGRKSTRRDVKSTPDLKALADNLPRDDMRRDLALEVVRLREELEKSKRKPPTGPAPTRRAEKPESGKFLIPASQANTIVRRAAGSESIEVHMPSRDENMPELQVLRRDSFRGKRPESTEDAGESAARQYVEKGSGRLNAAKFRPLLTILTAIVILGSLGGLGYIGWNALFSRATTDVAITEEKVGELALGADTTGLKEGPNGTLLSAEGWIVQHAGGKVTAITVKLEGENTQGVSMIAFGNRSMNLAEGTAAAQVQKSMGEPVAPMDKEALRTGTQSLKFRHNQGRAVLEFVYRGEDTGAIAVRLYSEPDAPPLPSLGD